MIDHFELFGLKQAIDRWRKTTPQAPVFRTPLFYMIVRHPLYLGFLIAFWATPYMTAGHLLFAIGMTVYLFIGASFEEKDLVALFDERYRRYQQQVGMILPGVEDAQKRTLNSRLWRGRPHYFFDVALSRSKLGPLWRAGLSRVGVRSAPDEDECGVSGTPLRLVLGLLRSPTRDKPARHRM